MKLSHESQQMISDKKIGWEFRVISNVMLEAQRNDDLVQKSQLEYYMSTDKVTSVSFQGWLGRKSKRLSELFELSMQTCSMLKMDESTLFGSPKKANYIERVIDLANSCKNIYMELIIWKITVETVNIDEEFLDLLPNISRLADPMIECVLKLSTVVDQKIYYKSNVRVGSYVLNDRMKNLFKNLCDENIYHSIVEESTKLLSAEIFTFGGKSKFGFGEEFDPSKW